MLVTTSVLLSVGEEKTNRRKHHFKGKVPRNYSIFAGLYFLCGVFFFLQTRCGVDLLESQLRNFFHSARAILVVLTSSKVKKETPLQRKDFRSAVRAKIHADSVCNFCAVFSFASHTWVNLFGFDLLNIQ